MSLSEYDENAKNENSEIRVVDDDSLYPYTKEFFEEAQRYRIKKHQEYIKEEKIRAAKWIIFFGVISIIYFVIRLFE